METLVNGYNSVIFIMSFYHLKRMKKNPIARLIKFAQKLTQIGHPFQEFSRQNQSNHI